MHAMFGITGGVALSPGRVPEPHVRRDPGRAGPRRARAGVARRRRAGRITPGGIREQDLPASVVAVAVSLVDFRTGYLVDLEGIRQVIGDRLLIVDATQGFGIVDAPYRLADVVVGGGQKWPRAGWGTGFLALSDRALDHLTPVWSGFNATDVRGHAAGRGAGPDPRSGTLLGEQPGSGGAGSLRRRAGGDDGCRRRGDQLAGSPRRSAASSTSPTSSRCRSPRPARRPSAPASWSSNLHPIS